MRGQRLLTDVQQLNAIAFLDDGRRIITSEKYSNGRACLAVYDPDSLQLLKAFIFAEGVEPPNAIGVISDPNRILVDIGAGLQIVDLQTLSPAGDSLPMIFDSQGACYADATWWQNLFDLRERYNTRTIGVFDGGKIATVHCGIAAPDMAAQLVTWDISSLQLKAGPVNTPNASPSPSSTDDMAGLPDFDHRQFITAQRYGWAHFWDIDTLRLLRAWRIESPTGCDRAIGSTANNQIRTIALSDDAKIIALGTWCGVIHICDVETGREVINSLIPHDFDYSKEESLSDPLKYAAEVTSLQFFAVNRLIACYADGSMRIWDIHRGIEIGETQSLNKNVDILFVIRRLRKVISARSNYYKSEVQVWNLEQYF